MTEQGGQLSGYYLAIAKSGHGKNRPQQCVEDALGAWSFVIGPGEFSSTKSTVNRIKEATDTKGVGLLCVQDEYGRKLAGWINAKMGHQVEMRAVLLEVATKGKGTWRRAKSAADGGDDLVVVAPCLSIYGSATPSSLEDVFKGDAVLDGLTGRHLVFRGVPVLPVRNDEHHLAAELPQTVKDAVLAIRAEHEAWHKSMLTYSPMSVLQSSEVRESMRVMADASDERRRTCTDEAEATVIARTAERVAHIATLLALLSSGADAMVQPRHLVVALAIHEASTRHLLLSTRRAEDRSTEFGRNLIKIQDLIKDKPGGLTKREITRGARWLDSRSLGSILESLTESGTVTVEKRATGGRPVTRYTYEG